MTGKRLLIICPTSTWGGVEKNVHLRTKSLLARGYEVHVVLLNRQFSERFHDCKGVRLHNLEQRGSDLSPKTYSRYIRIIQAVKPACVFVPLKHEWWAAALAARWCRVPRTVLYLGIQRRIRNHFKYRLMFRNWHVQLLVNSHYTRNYVTSTCRYLNEQNTHLIYNGFEVARPMAIPQDQSIRHTLPSNTYLIGCAGRLSRQKGFDLLPGVLAGLPKNVHLVIAGDGNLDAELKTLFSASDESHRIHMLGRFEPIDRFYPELDAFLLSSRNEGMANVLNEALCHGLPVVSTDVPGSREMLGIPDNEAFNGAYITGRHGLLTAKEDEPAMAKALLALIQGHVKFPAEHQRQRIIDCFNLTEMMDRSETLFFK